MSMVHDPHAKIPASVDLPSIPAKYSGSLNPGTQKHQVSGSRAAVWEHAGFKGSSNIFLLEFSMPLS